MCFRIRHLAVHHGEGGTKQLAGQRHLRGKLQRRELPPAAGGSGPEAGEEVCDRPRGREAAEHAGTGWVLLTGLKVDLCFRDHHFVLPPNQLHLGRDGQLRIPFCYFKYI